MRFARNLALRLDTTATISKTRCPSFLSFYESRASEFRRVHLHAASWPRREASRNHLLERTPREVSDSELTVLGE